MEYNKMNTYEKVSETEMKIITPTERIIDIENLKELRRDAGVVRELIISQHKTKLAEQDQIIAGYDLQLLEAKNLGIK